LFDAPSERAPCDINVGYTPLESTLSGLHSVADIIGLSSFV